MPAQVDITISDNADWTKVFTFKDQSGNPIDLTGSTFEMDIRDTAGAGEIATLTTANSRLALSATPIDGKLTVFIPKGVAPAGSAGETKYYAHDLVRTLSGVSERLWSGGLMVVKDIAVSNDVRISRVPATRIRNTFGDIKVALAAGSEDSSVSTEYLAR